MSAMFYQLTNVLVKILTIFCSRLCMLFLFGLCVGMFVMFSVRGVASLSETYPNAEHVINKQTNT